MGVILKFLLVWISVIFAGFSYAQTTTVAISDTFSAGSYRDVTPGGGFPAGTTLTSLSLTLTSFANVSGSVIFDDFAVVVADASVSPPFNASNTVFATQHAGGWAAPLNAGWSPSITLGLTGVVNLATPIDMNGKKLWVGNGYSSGSGNWVGTFSYPAATPSAPTITAVTAGDTNGSVTFSAPTSYGGSAITGYTATCTSSNGGTSGSLTGSASPLTVTGLTNGKTYTCTVLATNSFGNSPSSTASSTFVPNAAPAAIPTLGEWAMIFMASLMAMIGIRRMRRE